MADDAKLEEYLQSAIDIAREAGKVINEAFHKEKTISTKTALTDLVTETDEFVEKLIIGNLKAKYPSHSFIGEESVSAGEACTLTDNPTWIIDPIDGTTNFIHRYSFVCISIGLSINKESQVGLVYNSVLNEMYTAIKGKGAFLNGKKIYASKETELSRSLIITELGSNRSKERLDVVMKNVRTIAEEPDAVHGIRIGGSAACNLCAVARGAADGYFQFGIHVWDIAAGILIVQEAGGVVCNPNGGPLDMMFRVVLAAGTEAVAKSLVEQITPIEYPSD